MKKRPILPKKNQAPCDKAILPEQDLFPETLPAFAPAWPAPETLPGQALARMLSGERLTQISFGFHGWRLAAYVKELDYLGWPVRKSDVHCPAGYGHGRPIAEYWLPPDAIARGRALREGLPC